MEIENLKRDIVMAEKVITDIVNGLSKRYKTKLDVTIETNELKTINDGSNCIYTVKVKASL